MRRKYYLAISSLVVILLAIVAGCAPQRKPNIQMVTPATASNWQTRHHQVIPINVALLLPLSGKYAKQGQSIRNGFFAAYYAAKQQGFVPNIKVYDTAKENVLALYQQAVQEGAALVVGPLLKNNVAQLAATKRLTVPTVALNSLAGKSPVHNLIEFALSPVDEADQVASKIAADQHNRVLIIAPTSSWAKPMLQAFMQRWQSLDGKVIANIDYASRAHLAQQISQTLHINKAYQRRRQLATILGEKLRFTARRRQDFDAIFVIATPNMGRQILPLLKFYYAGNVPIYSTSLIYQGNVDPRLDRDLDGVRFIDMPWVLTAQQKLQGDLPAIQENITQYWPKNYRHNVRLYALGVDAYDVIPNLKPLIDSADYSVAGATGQLYLLANQHIYRQLLWAKMVDGKPSLMNSV